MLEQKERRQEKSKQVQKKIINTGSIRITLSSKSLLQLPFLQTCPCLKATPRTFQ